MIARDHYAGPMTKSAQAMFARAERRAQGRVQVAERALSPVRAAVNSLGLTLPLLQRWEDAGLIAFERRRGKRLIDEAAMTHLSMVASLRRAGFTIKEIAWLSDTTPPPIEVMRAALSAQLQRREVARARTLVQAILGGDVA